MGGKAHADNSQIVKEQQQQAKDAAAKEALRQSRISTGLKKIGFAFEGKPVRAPTTHTFDWKNFNDKTVLPKGYTRVQVGPNGKAIAGTPATPGTPGGGAWDNNGNYVQTPGTPGTPAGPATGGVTAIMGPDGKIYKSGKAFTYSTNDPTGATTGGFDDAFYKNYGDQITNYYDTDLAKQYGKAQDSAMYSLARSGSSVSSAGDALVADLASQNTDRSVDIANKADQAVAAKKADIAAQKSKAVAQLYATENPDVAANQATAAVRDISLAGPDLSPLAQLFNIATVGATRIAQGFNNQNLVGNFQSGLPGKQGSGNIVNG